MKRFVLISIFLAICATLTAQVQVSQNMSENTDTVTVKTGTLRIVDIGGAAGSLVFLDGQEIGTLPLPAFPVSAGEHTISFEKDKFLSRSSLTNVRILEGLETVFNIGTGRTGKYHFTSIPDQANLLIDGQLLGKTPWEGQLTEGKHRVRIERAGYPPYDEPFTVKKGDKVNEFSIDLTKIHPITIDCEEDSLLVVVRQGKTVISEGKKTPALLQLPYSDRNYQLKLYRQRVNHPVYWGPLSFKGDGKMTHRVRTHSNKQFYVISAEIKSYDGGNQRFAFYDPQLHLFRAAIFPGLTFPLIKASAFGVDPAPSVGSMFRENGFLLGVSVLTNAELRLGGAITDWMDIAALGTFSWYPDWKKLIPDLTSGIPFLTTGMDYFAGVEVSTRIPVFLSKVKTGFQWYNIQGLPESRSGNKPFFVVSLGISLGDRWAWGENIIRLF